MSHDIISRKALVAALIKERDRHPPETEERYSFGVKLPNHFNQAIRGGIHKALRLVETAPAIDAEPVRHGCEYCAGKRVEYQQTKSTKLYIDTHGNTRALVTECNRCPHYARCSMNGIPILAAFPINYCPNCGAKMRCDEDASE